MNQESHAANIQRTMLLVDSAKRPSQTLAEFARYGYKLTLINQLGESLTNQLKLAPIDIIVINVTSANNELVRCLSDINAIRPTPVIVFADQHANNLIEQLIDAGVNAYVIGEVNHARLPSILELAIARFSQHQKLKDKLSKTQAKLNAEQAINQAKLWLMETKKLTEQQAYRSMRKSAMDSGQKLEQVATQILTVAKMLSS